jgi:hypothetical protein
MTSLAIDPALKDLWTYWCARRVGGAVPRFEAMDLGALGPVAERVLVVRREGGRFRYVSVGASVRTINGYEISASIRFIVDRLMLPLANPDGTIGGVICGQIMRSELDGAPLGVETIAASAEDQLVFLDLPGDSAAPRASGDA